eukprot:TRINITY_DN756_c0_g4_i1.p1 TRINITY_DN756_c0_g4~~TRINITY_DN756_c0_g4_i1.p1  ORF type:complete len:531 (+),score=167.47 TRINITY_DN756_c0_g4_i1:60-1652(+)
MSEIKKQLDEPLLNEDDIEQMEKEGAFDNEKDDMIEEDFDSDNVFNNNRKIILDSKTRMAYAVGDFSASAIISILLYYLLPFFFGVAGVHPFTAALILFLARAWDAITDLIIGRLSDLTNTKYGRRRPWLLLGTIPLAASYFFLWQVFPFGDEFGKFAYYLFWLILIQTFFTCLSVPHFALGPEMTNVHTEQIKLTSYKLVVYILGSLIGVGGQGLILQFFGEDNRRLGYFFAALIFGFIFIFPPLITFYYCKEEAGDLRGKKNQPSFSDGLKLTMNRPFISLCLAFLFSLLGIQFIQSNIYLYVQYVLDNENEVIFVIIVLQISTAIFIPIWGALSIRISKQMTFVIGIIFCTVPAGCFIILFESIFYAVYPIVIFFGIGVAAVTITSFSMLAEVIDYDEKQTSFRREGVYFGLFIFVQKLASSIGLALASFLLGIAGFETDQTDKDDVSLGVLIVLRCTVGVLPVLFFILSLIPIYFYNISNKSTKSRYEVELSEFDTNIDIDETNNNNNDNNINKSNKIDDTSLLDE